MKRCRFIPYTLFFYRPAGTSRGVLYKKLSYFIEWKDAENSAYYGECGLLKGLSIDDKPGYEQKLHEVCQALEEECIDSIDLSNWPSIQCGVEMLSQAQKNQFQARIFDNDFYHKGSPIPINGLIWMGDRDFMYQQIHEKVDAGYRCIKMKVGALEWEIEKQILQELRIAGGEELVIRVDANGAWKYNDASKRKMEFLHNINVHSIEQPVKQGSNDSMRKMIEWSPVPVALDEELFIHTTSSERKTLLDKLQPDFIVLKPSLVGGFTACDEWIKLASQRNIGYWLTSALESNVGLNAISQYAFPHAGDMFQGLGTGSLYENNIPSPLEVVQDTIRYNREASWNLELLTHA